MDENKVRIFIESARNKMKDNLSIKEEIFALSSIYDYIKDYDDYGDLISMIKLELDEFMLYQKRHEDSKKNKVITRIRIERENQYRMLWGTQSFFFKLIHRNLSPDNNDLSKMVSEDINRLIDKLSTLKK